MPTIQNEGEYDVQLIPPATPAEWFTTTETGTDGWALKFATQDGSTIHTNLWLTPNAYDRSTKTMQEVFGMTTYRDLAMGKPLANLKATIVVEGEEYKNKVRMKVKWINPRGGVAVSKSADVDAVLKRLALLENRTAQQATRSQRATQELEGDDIPF